MAIRRETQRHEKFMTYTLELDILIVIGCVLYLYIAFSSSLFPFITTLLQFMGNFSFRDDKFYLLIAEYK